MNTADDSVRREFEIFGGHSSSTNETLCTAIARSKGKMDGYFSPARGAKLNTVAENVFLRRETGEEKAATCKRIAFATGRNEGKNRTLIVESLATLWLPKREEGRRARPRYDVPLHNAVPPTWVRRDAIT
jgi:hypothetical protein